MQQRDFNTWFENVGLHYENADGKQISVGSPINDVYDLQDTFNDFMSAIGFVGFRVEVIRNAG